jgi:hypothetical protein
MAAAIDNPLARAWSSVSPVYLRPLKQAPRDGAPLAVAPRAALPDALAPQVARVRLTSRSIVLGDVRAYNFKLEPEPLDLASVLHASRPLLEAHFGERNVILHAPLRTAFVSTAVCGLPPPLSCSIDCGAHRMSLTLSGPLADSLSRSAVYDYVVRCWTANHNYRRAGRRYIGPAQLLREDVRAALAFRARVGMLSTEGARLTMDAAYLVVQPRSVLKMVVDILDLEGLNATLDTRDPRVRRAWEEAVFGRRVLYRGAAYAIRGVDFEKTPRSEFGKVDRRARRVVPTTYLQHHATEAVTDTSQPLLVAETGKGERVHLIPELAFRLGMDEGLGRDELNQLLLDVGSQPAQRLACASRLFAELAPDALPSPFGATLGPECVVDAVALAPPTVELGGARPFPTAGGNFQQFMRYGLQDPKRLTNWLFISPADDQGLLDLWLQSLRDVGHVAFGMRITDPRKLMYYTAHRDLLPLLEEELRPGTQLVMLIVKPNEADRAYTVLKQTTLKRAPVISQMVRSDTIRKRFSIAAIMSRICLQINAKLGGPLWHVNLRVAETAPLLAPPTMVVGIYELRHSDGSIRLGMAASYDTACGRYFSRSESLGAAGQRARVIAAATAKVQLFLRDATLHFAEFMGGLLPEHLIVYRAPAGEGSYARLRDTELWACRRFLEALARGAPPASTGAVFAPRLTFVAVAPGAGERMYPVEMEGQGGHVVSGTLVNHANCPGFGERFTLLSQGPRGGTASPSVYCVLADDSGAPLQSLQTLTYRLTFVYANATQACRMPAPLHHAKRVATALARVGIDEPHEYLKRTMWYL